MNYDAFKMSESELTDLEMGVCLLSPVTATEIKM